MSRHRLIASSIASRRAKPGVVIAVAIVTIAGLSITPRRVKAGCIADSAGAYGPVSIVACYDTSRFQYAENVAVGADGTRYVSLSYAGSIDVIPAHGATSRLVISSGGAVGGLAFEADGSLDTVVTSGTPSSVGFYRASNGTVSQIAGLPAGAAPNGLAIDSNGNRYSTDGSTGAIWRLAPGATGASQWIQSNLLKRSSGGVSVPGYPNFLVPGANGLKVYNGYVYFSNSSTATIYRSKILSDGSSGPIEAVFADTVADDFAFDADGNLFIATNGFSNEVIRITPSGDRTVIASAANGLDSPSAVAFGTDADSSTLYISNLGLFGTDHESSLLSVTDVSVVPEPPMTLLFVTAVGVVSGIRAAGLFRNVPRIGRRRLGHRGIDARVRHPTP